MVNPDDKNYCYAPERIQGYLLKDSPAPWRRCGVAAAQAQMRFVVISEGRLFWSVFDTVDSAGLPVEIAGVVDLVLNECELIDDDDSSFVLVPREGKWSHGSFTGMARGRSFRFDTSPSAIKKKKWMSALREHLKYASHVRASPVPPHRSALPEISNSFKSFLGPPELPPSATFGAQDKEDPPALEKARTTKRLSNELQVKSKRWACFAALCNCLCAEHPMHRANRKGLDPYRVRS